MDGTDTLLWCCLSILLGVLLSSILAVPSLAIWIIVSLAIIFLFFAKKNKNFIVAALGLLLFSFGIFHYANSLERIRTNTLASLDKQTVRIIGAVAEDIGRDTEKSKVTVDVLSKEGRAVGRMMVYTDKFINLEYRDKIMIVGEMKKPEKIEDFDYPGYLAKDGISSIMTYPEIVVIEKHFYSNFWQRIVSAIYSFKEMAREEIKSDMSIKESAVMQGMILGDSDKMDSDFKQSLSLSGLSHVIAISGSHIVLFSAMLFEVLILLGLWRKQAQGAVIIFTFAYIFLSGMLASAVRSWIMISLMLFAQIIDRASGGLRAMVFAGALMVIGNPLLLKFDLGFQLSFLAVFGLIFAGPVFNEWLDKLFKGRYSFLREVMAMTLSAELFTFPILACTFGYFSAVSFLANIIVAPIVPIIMATGVLFPLLGMICHPLGFAASLICSMFVKCLIFIIEISPRIPFATIQTDIPFILLILFYIPIILFLSKEKKRKNLDFLRQ